MFLTFPVGSEWRPFLPGSQVVVAVRLGADCFALAPVNIFLEVCQAFS